MNNKQLSLSSSKEKRNHHGISKVLKIPIPIMEDPKIKKKKKFSYSKISQMRHLITSVVFGRLKNKTKTESSIAKFFPIAWTPRWGKNWKGLHTPSISRLTS